MARCTAVLVAEGFAMMDAALAAASHRRAPLAIAPRAALAFGTGESRRWHPS